MNNRTSVPMGVGLQPTSRTNYMPLQMLEAHINQFASQHPQQLAQIRAVIQEALLSGELTQQELNTAVQLMTLAAQNPDIYPYVRKYAIQHGLADDEDLPAQYDPGFVFLLLLAAKAAQADLGGQNIVQGGTPMMAGEQPVPSMATGGSVPPSQNADGSVLVNAHEGEYVIPKYVVEMKGREFFDNLVEKYKKRM